MTEGVISPVKVDGWPSSYVVQGSVSLVPCANAKPSLFKVTTLPIVLEANPNRRGLLLYNVGATPVYGSFDKAADLKTNVAFALATGASWTMPLPIYTGAMSFVRASGDGSLCITELF